MNPNPQSQESPKYEPRDPHFYMLALSTISAALVPATASPVYHSADHIQAEETARAAAKLLDGGIAPEGFIQRAISRRMAEIREYQATVGLVLDQRHNPTGQPVRIGTAAEVTRARETEAKRVEKEGPQPTIEELKDRNAKDLARFRDLSEPVRDAALRSSVLRLAATTEITGARPEEALGIVCEEILRALRFAEEAGVSIKGLPEEADIAEVAAGVPYPANLAALALVGVISAAQDARASDKDEDPQTVNKGPGA